MDELPIGEALCAVLGVEGYLSREPKTMTLGILDKAEKLPRRIRGMCRKFLAKAEFEPQKHRAPTAPSYQDLLEWLYAEHDLADVARLVAAFHDQHDTAEQFKRIADNASAYLQGHIARRSRETMTDAVAIVPSRQELAEFGRRWEAINTPEVALGRLLTGTLSSAGADALRTVYPAIYAFTLQCLTGTLGRKRTATPSYVIPYRKDVQLQTLIGSRLGSRVLDQLLQTPIKSAKPSSVSASKPSKAADAAQTQTDKLEKR